MQSMKNLANKLSTKEERVIDSQGSSRLSTPIVEDVTVIRKTPIVETVGLVALPANHVDHSTVMVEPVVEETIRRDTLVQVQPVVHKEVEKEEVHHIIKNINEARAPSVAGTVTLAPVVEEHVHTHVIDEIRPVIHREIVEQDVKFVEAHKDERVVVPTKHVEEVITENVVAPFHVKLQPEIKSVPTKVALPMSSEHKTVVVEPVVEEVIRRDTLVQVQPIVHKEIEKEEVHHIFKHINEAPAPSVAGTVTLAPVVEKHVHTHVVDEIHPVIHREVVEQDVKRVEDHRKEHIVAPATHLQEVVTENVVAPFHVKLQPEVVSVPRKIDLAASADHKTIVTDAVVEETIRRDTLVQVQPIVHKEIQVEEVHHITKHINEAPAPSVAGTVTLAPVVQEHLHTRVIDEIHPIIHRELVEQEVKRVEDHRKVHVVSPTTHLNEVVTENVVAPFHVKLQPEVVSAPRKIDLAASADHKTVVADAVVEETIRRDTLVQVQPVIHKEVEVEEVHHITKHINEARAPSVAGSVTLAPVVQEHVHTLIVDEVHPVIHREIAVQEVERRENHIVEKVVLPTTHTTEVIIENVPMHIHTKECAHLPGHNMANIIMPGTATLPLARNEVVVDHHLHKHTTEHAHKHGDSLLVEGRQEKVVLVGERKMAGGIVDGGHIDRHHHEVVGDRHVHPVSEVTLLPGQEILAGSHTDRTVLVNDPKHMHHDKVHHEKVHTEKVHDVHHDKTHEEKKHHHLHLPHFLGGHKKEETVHHEKTVSGRPAL